MKNVSYENREQNRSSEHMSSRDKDKTPEVIHCCFIDNCKENYKEHAKALTLWKQHYTDDVMIYVMMANVPQGPRLMMQYAQVIYV